MGVSGTLGDEGCFLVGRVVVAVERAMLVGLALMGKGELGQPLAAMMVVVEAQPSPPPLSFSLSSPPPPTSPAPSPAHPSLPYNHPETPPHTPVRISSSARSSVGVWAVRRCVSDWMEERGR